MADWIGRLLGRLVGPEWRLFFLRKGLGIEYCLHNKDGFALLGYLQAKFRDRGERISDNWELLLSHYTGGQEHDFQLTEFMFTDAGQFQSLITKCRTLDKNFDKRATRWRPRFLHVPTRKQLPLGGPTGDDFRNSKQYIERLEEGLSNEISFSTISNEVFVHRGPWGQWTTDVEYIDDQSQLQARTVPEREFLDFVDKAIAGGKAKDFEGCTVHILDSKRGRYAEFWTIGQQVSREDYERFKDQNNNLYVARYYESGEQKAM